MVKILKEKINPYPGKICLKFQGKKKTFSGKQKLIELITVNIH